MLYSRCQYGGAAMLGIWALLLLVGSSNAWTSQSSFSSLSLGASNQQPHRDSSSLLAVQTLDGEMSSCDFDSTTSPFSGRRAFVCQSVGALATTILTPIVVNADDEDSPLKSTPVVATTTTAAVAEPTPADDTAKPPPEEKATTPPVSDDNPKATTPTDAKPSETKTESTSDAAPNTEKLQAEEKELVAEIKQDEKDDIKAEQDTAKLISEIEKETKDEPKKEETSTAKPAEEKPLSSVANKDETPIAAKKEEPTVEPTPSSTKALIETLEKEEEKIEEETRNLIEKVETLEAEAEALKQPLLKEPGPPAKAAEKSQAETQEFLSKLKEREVEKVDLITRLKQESYEKYMDEKTGVYKPMTKEEFESRADFLQFLKDSVYKDKVFDKVLEQFRKRLEK